MGNGENYIMKSLTICSPTQYCSGDKIKSEMGGSRSTYEGEAYVGFWWGSLRARDHLGDPGVDGDNIKMDLKEVRCEV